MIRRNLFLILLNRNDSDRLPKLSLHYKGKEGGRAMTSEQGGSKWKISKSLVESYLLQIVAKESSVQM
jgi:hypothetical protein